MKTLVAAVVLALLFGSAAYGGWYVTPSRAYAYYPYPAVPVYAYRVPVVVAPPPPVYMPVAPAPIVTAGPVWVGPPAVWVRGKVYVYGRPVRNVVRAVLP
jgi:hypothetical protein